MAGYYLAPSVAVRERIDLLVSGPGTYDRPGSHAHAHGLRDAARARVRLAAVLAMELGTADEWETLTYWLEQEAAMCPTCGSDDPNHTEPVFYVHRGRDCSDGFHEEADGG